MPFGAVFSLVFHRVFHVSSWFFMAFRAKKKGSAALKLSLSKASRARIEQEDRRRHPRDLQGSGGIPVSWLMADLNGRRARQRSLSSWKWMESDGNLRFPWRKRAIFQRFVAFFKRLLTSYEVFLAPQGPRDRIRSRCLEAAHAAEGPAPQLQPIDSLPMPSSCQKIGHKP